MFVCRMMLVVVHDCTCAFKKTIGRVLKECT